MPAEPPLETVDPRLGRILKEYLEAVERGERPSAEDWIVRHAEFAQPLREFFASRRQLDQLLGEAQRAAVDSPTLAPFAGTYPSSSAITKLRYFGDYELECEIARGGMGVVYRARQVSLNRPVAVKMILAGELASAEDVARFQSEAEAAANLDHPAIVPIYEIGQRDGQHYFSMKFIDGQSLTQWLQARAGSPLTRPEVERRVKLLSTVARGIHYAHQRGIIHRDLKPANILIDSEGQPHVTDFGLARRAAQGSELTRTGAIVGTPSFMAPEQALGGGKSATTAVDIYGLGAILYAALAGRPPFEGATPLETILQVQQSAPVPLSKLAPRIEKDLETICLKCLEKDPEARYRSAGELADDLDRWQRSEPIAAAPPNAARLLGRWLATHFRAATCVLLIGVVTGLLICEMPINMLAHNLGPYALIYRGSFPAEAAPWILKFLESYPRPLGLLALPLALVCYFGMGWFTDRLVKPHDLAGAILSGLGVGTAAAVTAFLIGIGWQTLIQVAVWPSQPDLELLVTEITRDSTFSDGKTISTRYPGDVHGNPVYTRYVMKKALADMQARIPLGLWYGALFSAGLLLLPATLQTVAAQYLRTRGDRGFWQVLQLLEVSFPASLTLVAYASFAWNFPRLAAQVLLLPLVALVIHGLLRKAEPSTRMGSLAVFGALGLLLLIVHREAFFTNRHGANLALVAAGALAAAAAVLCRFRWWERLSLYGVWFAALIITEGVLFGARSSLDPGVGELRQQLASASGVVVILALTATYLWRRARSSVNSATAAIAAGNTGLGT